MSAHVGFLVFLPQSPTLSTPALALPHSLLWDRRPRGAAGFLFSPNKQEKKKQPCKASSEVPPHKG